MNASNGSVITKSSRLPQPFSRFGWGGRRTWIALAAILLVGGAALNWGWLVAAGIAPLLLALAPCAAMCALGLCMKGGNACKSESNGAVPVRAANAAGEGGAEPA